eukprot:6084276-Lingulodinium_polyedra.AAC.1
MNVQLFFLLAADDLQVCATEAVAPAAMFLQIGRRLVPQLGLVLRQVGELASPLVVCAKQAFAHLSHAQIKKLLAELGEQASKPPSLMEDVLKAISTALPGLSDEAKKELLAKRGLPAPGLDPDLLPEDIWEDATNREEAEQIKAPSLDYLPVPCVPKGCALECLLI